MTDIAMTLKGVFAHELNEQVVIDALTAFIDHADEHRFDVIDGMTLHLKDENGKFQATFTVHVVGTHRWVELTQYVDIH